MRRVVEAARNAGEDLNADGQYAFETCVRTPKVENAPGSAVGLLLFRTDKCELGGGFGEFVELRTR